jgi:hypothetical protein
LIGHDNSGFGPAWFLDRIIVEDVTGHQTYEFLCNRWLAKNEDDKQISRILFPTKAGDIVKPPVGGKVTFVVIKKACLSIVVV